MNSFKLAALAVALVGLSACNDYSSPEGAVKTTYKALAEQKLDVYQKSLTPEAFDQLGSAETMSELRALLEGKKLKLGKTEIVSRVPLRDQGRERRTYLIEVNARPEGDSEAEFGFVLAALVKCDVYQTLVREYYGDDYWYDRHGHRRAGRYARYRDCRYADPFDYRCYDSYGRPYGPYVPPYGRGYHTRVEEMMDCRIDGLTQ